MDTIQSADKPAILVSLLAHMLKDKKSIADFNQLELWLYNIMQGIGTLTAMLKELQLYGVAIDKDKARDIYKQTCTCVPHKIEVVKEMFENWILDVAQKQGSPPIDISWLFDCVSQPSS